MDYITIVPSVAPLAVTICNNLIKNNFLALALAIIVAYSAIILTLLLRCKNKNGTLDYKKLLINSSVIVSTTVVFGVLYSVADFIPMGMLIKSLLGVFIAMLISYGIYKSYTSLNGFDECKTT